MIFSLGIPISKIINATNFMLFNCNSIYRTNIFISSNKCNIYLFFILIISFFNSFLSKFFFFFIRFLVIFPFFSSFIRLLNRILKIASRYNFQSQISYKLIIIQFLLRVHNTEYPNVNTEAITKNHSILDTRRDR